MQDMYEKNRKNRPLSVTLRALLGILCAVFVLIAVVYGYYHTKVTKLVYDGGKLEQAGSITEEEAAEDELVMEDATAELELAEATLSGSEIFDDKGVFNILLIGTDERTKEFSTNARGDSCMLLSINKKTGKGSLVSFERGQGVPIPSGSYAGQWDWLTHLFRYGGADMMMQVIRECYRVDVKYYVRVNIYTFIKLVDAVGGVDIELTEAEADYINSVREDSLSHLPEDAAAGNEPPAVSGVNHLGGAMAMLYARCRKIDNDWMRISRQRVVIQAAIDGAKDMSLREIDSMLDTVLPLVQTNLTEREIDELVLLAPIFLGKQMQQMTMPDAGTYGSMTGMGGRKMFAVDFEENSKRLQQRLYGEEE